MAMLCLDTDKFLYSVLDRGRMTKAAPNEKEKSTVVKESYNAKESDEIKNNLKI